MIRSEVQFNLDAERYVWVVNVDFVDASGEATDGVQVALLMDEGRQTPTVNQIVEALDALSKYLKVEKCNKNT